MKTKIEPTAEQTAASAAAFFYQAIVQAVQQSNRALVAVSGGHTPWIMLRKLAEQQLPWDKLIFFQVDERDCPINDPQRNLAHLRACLPSAAQIRPMPVEAGLAGAETYMQTLTELAGAPPVLDVVHLGLGPDGHTASLVPDDPVLDESQRDVAWTHPYQGHRRMTMTFPLLNRARQIFWLVTGADKQEAVQRLLAGDKSIPASRITAANRLLFADESAMGDTIHAA